MKPQSTTPLAIEDKIKIGIWILFTVIIFWWFDSIAWATVFSIGIGIAFIITSANEGHKSKLKSEYQAALRGSDKAKALEAGRAYYSVLRDGKLTIYDEQAITNDLSSMMKERSDTTTELERLFELKSKGVLTEEEFKAKKAKVLGIDN